MFNTPDAMFKESEDYKINAIPVLEDNIIWVWSRKNQAVVVDPAIAEPVQAWLKARELELLAVLQTHHHWDHIGGTLELIKQWPQASVIASKKDLDRIPFQTISVSDGEELKLLGSTAKVVEVVGHTRSHIAYYITTQKRESNDPPRLFCGDTLFGAGCGRLFEGTAEEMFNSLQLINSLPAETKIYCAHEYTESNLRWANSIYPKNFSIQTRLLEVTKKRELGLLSLPSTISEERETNLFLRAKTISELCQLRQHKDNWKE